MSFTDEMTLGDARDTLRDLVDQGHPCPCCTQFAKVYRRKINATMARALISLWRTSDHQFVHAPSLPGDTHEMSQLVWWGLIAEEAARREDGGRAGWWRVTDLGERFVLCQARVPKYARIYDGRCLGVHGDLVSIRDCLGDRFDYGELMRA